jgi:hypothetical protein
VAAATHGPLGYKPVFHRCSALQKADRAACAPPPRPNPPSSDIEELTLKCAGSTQLRLLFGDPMLAKTSHVRLHGDAPFDREWNSLTLMPGAAGWLGGGGTHWRPRRPRAVLAGAGRRRAAGRAAHFLPVAGGKQLVLIGGASRSHEDAGRDAALLTLDGLEWERPEAARLEAGLHGHSATPIGRSRLLVLFGARSGEAAGGGAILFADGPRWAPLVLKGAGPEPPPRLAHAAACARERVFVFGGVGADGRLLADLWSLDLDAMQWAQHTATGAAPCARKGAVWGGGAGGMAEAALARLRAACTGTTAQLRPCRPPPPRAAPRARRLTVRD